MDEIIRKFLPIVYNFVYRLARDKSLAEDITQETFIKVWKNLSKLDPERDKRPWILSIARNTTIDWLRKKQPLTFSQLSNDEDQDFSEQIADLGPWPDELFARQELGQLLANALDELPPVYREVVVLHQEGDLSLEEVSQVVGRPLNTVKSQYRRALLRLRGILAAAPK